MRFLANTFLVLFVYKVMGVTDKMTLSRQISRLKLNHNDDI